MPPEILSSIFENVVRDNLLESDIVALNYARDATTVTRPAKASLAPLNIGGVCHSWRNLILSLPGHWSSFAVLDVSDKAEVLVGVRLLLKRSGNRKLRIRIFNNYPVYPPSFNIADEIMLHSTRISDLHIDGHLKLLYQPLHSTRNTNTSQQIHIDILTDLPLQQITHLDFSFWNDDVDLDMLASFPQLTDATLTFDLAEVDYGPRLSPVRLQRLSTLRIRLQGTVLPNYAEMLLTNLTFPALKVFSLHNFKPTCLKVIVEQKRSSTEWAQEAFPQLSPDQDLVDIFRVQLSKTFSLTTYRMGDDIDQRNISSLESLVLPCSPTDPQAALLPNLVKFFTDFGQAKPCIDPLLAMLQSRIGQLMET
ncbi:hypothetical protein C8J56DRAFT_1063096 [Mycena floridula]|nr:hypothetical protein C8J56DRAFT_1063096 [Mycena floridula]